MSCVDVTLLSCVPAPHLPFGVGSTWPHHPQEKSRLLSTCDQRRRWGTSVGTTYLQEGVHLLLDPVHKPPLDDQAVGKTGTACNHTVTASQQAGGETPTVAKERGGLVPGHTLLITSFEIAGTHVKNLNSH